MNDTQRKPGIGRPFGKNDPRINRSGRPKHFDQFRALAQKIAHEKVPGPDGNALTTIELILRRWSKSKEPQLQRAFVEYAFGKVPEKLETTGLEQKTVLRLHFTGPDGKPFHPPDRWTKQIIDERTSDDAPGL